MNLFLIGSGFTKALYPDAPLNDDLLTQLCKNSENSGCRKLFERYKINDIEICLTKLDIDKVSNRDEADALKSLRNTVENELAKFFYDYVASKDLLASSVWANNFFQNAISEGDVVISLNYDCVFEGMLDLVGKWTPKGGYGKTFDNNPLHAGHEKSPVTVLKIHGSASFMAEPNLKDNSKAETINFTINEHFFPKSGKDTEFGSDDDKSKPFIIAPSYVKIPALAISYLMLEALKASTEARKLIIIGCGLRPEDSFLTLLITNFLDNKQNGKIIIADLKPDERRDKIQEYYEDDVKESFMLIEGNIENTVYQLITKIR